MSNNDKVLGFIGLCKKAGKLLVGDESADAAMRNGKAELVLLAADAAEGTQHRVGTQVGRSGTPLLVLPYSKTTLGDMLGRRVCAVLAVTDRSMATRLAELNNANVGSDG